MGIFSCDIGLVIAYIMAYPARRVKQACSFIRNTLLHVTIMIT